MPQRFLPALVRARRLGRLSRRWLIFGGVIAVTACQESSVPTTPDLEIGRPPPSVGINAAVPPSFTDAQVVAGLSNPTLMAIAPDGRFFVSEQAGKVRVVKNGVLLATPFVTLSVNSAGERGALGIAFDPAFVSNQRVYVYYTSSSGPHNRVSRFDDGVAGGNYGWPTTEGNTTDPNFISPFYTYNHSAGCAITGGDFYNPTTVVFPSSYVGDYFFADYCGGWIRSIDIGTKVVSNFASGISSPTDLHVGNDGALYYLARGSGSIRKITYTSNNAPSISQHPANQTVNVGGSATFTVTASGTAPHRSRPRGWHPPGGRVHLGSVALAQRRQPPLSSVLRAGQRLDLRLLHHPDAG